MCYSRFGRLVFAGTLVHPFQLLEQKSTFVFVSITFTFTLLLYKPSIRATLNGLSLHVAGSWTTDPMGVSDNAFGLSSYGILIYVTLFANVALVVVQV